MIKQHFLTPTLAEKMIKLGFSSICLGFYDKDGNFYFPDVHESIPGAYPTPTWMQAIEWFVERKGLILTIDWDENFNYLFTINGVALASKVVWRRVGGYNSYNEARDAGIENLINLCK